MKMKTKFYVLLSVAVMLALLTACGTPVTSTPTVVEEPTDFTIETETMVPTMETTMTEMVMDTETPAMNATSETTTPTATGPAGTVPVSLVCWFCVRQVPHVIVTVPQTATFEVLASSAPIQCTTVETVDELQVVLCKGPAQSGNVSFDLNVCSNGQCSERHLAAVDCSATAMPTDMMVTGTVTGTVTATGTPAAAGTMTVTPAAGTGTTTPAMAATSSGTPTIAMTPTPTP